MIQDNSLSINSELFYRKLDLFYLFYYNYTKHSDNSNIIERKMYNSSCLPKIESEKWITGGSSIYAVKMLIGALHIKVIFRLKSLNFN